MVLEITIQEWRGFRRALRKDEQELFDRMMNRARQYGDAVHYAPRLNPTESLIMGIMLAQEKELEKIGDDE